jgi:hypothetical protein
MAGVKITDLTPLATAASDDLLYIVDVSDNTQSPQGTSKQIEVGNLFSSGTYTPTISAEVNLTAAPNSATYIRVGNIATVSAQLNISMNAGEVSGSFEISLPVASNLTTQKQCFGLLQWSFAGDMTEIIGLSIGAETFNNTCLVEITTATTRDMPYCTLQFQYEIL